MIIMPFETTIVSLLLAKATQVANIYQKHFPEEWDLMLEKQNKDGLTYLAEHPGHLAKLTRHISKTKFVALLRPDYGFGVGREGIDLTEMVASDKTMPSSPPSSSMLDPQLLEQVCDDLVMTCPMEHPQVWENFNAKLRPGQTLWDRHDLVLKMVKAIQVQKKGVVEGADPTPPSQNKEQYKYNVTGRGSVDASRRGKHASS